MSDAERVAACLAQNAALWELLARLEGAGFGQVYVGAGCLAQTVWNVQSGRAPAADVLDCDLVYFDPERADAESERALSAELRVRTADLGLRLDVCNQARVHCWYEAEFGRAIAPFVSLLDAVASWPTTATCVAVRRVQGGLEWLAPYGFHDLLHGVVRPNTRLVSREQYERKVARWRSCWPQLRVVPWQSRV